MSTNKSINLEAITMTHVLVHPPYAGLECRVLSTTADESTIFLHGTITTIPTAWIEAKKNSTTKKEKPCKPKPTARP